MEFNGEKKRLVHEFINISSELVRLEYKNGAGEQIRTVDLRITSALLYLWATPASNLKLKFITQDILYYYPDFRNSKFKFNFHKAF